MSGSTRAVPLAGQGRPPVVTVSTVARGGRRSGRGGRNTPDPAAAGGSGGAHGASHNGFPHDRAPLVRDVSAGGVVYRPAGEGDLEPRVVLVGRLRPKRWALPKGTPQAGETLEQTALREVAEETGLEARIVQPLEEIQYWFVWGGVRHFKTVHFYLMLLEGGNTANHDGEYDVVEWFPINEALRALSYPNEARVVEKALAALVPTSGGAPDPDPTT